MLDIKDIPEDILEASNKVRNYILQHSRTGCESLNGLSINAHEYYDKGLRDGRENLQVQLRKLLNID